MFNLYFWKGNHESLRISHTWPNSIKMQYVRLVSTLEDIRESGNQPKGILCGLKAGVQI